MKTAEQRFDQVTNLFIKAAKHRYKEALQNGMMTEQMHSWINLKGEFQKAFHLDRTFASHFSHRRLMTLGEMVNLFHWIFTHFETEEERLVAWLNAGTLFFLHTKECESNRTRPFSRPLAEILKTYINREVERRVKEELRIREIKKMEEKMERRR